MHMGGMFHRPRRYGGGGGCLGGLIGMAIIPIILVLVLVTGIFGTVFSGFGQFFGGTGGSGSYDEEVFQDFADEQYAREFGSASAYEDNLLIVFLTDEDHYNYYYIAWVGDHIATDINHMLGNNSTELGRAMGQCINESSYKYSLDSNLAQVMDTMTAKVRALGLESSFTCSESHGQAISHLTNRTDLELTSSTVNRALEDFTQATGINAVIVVEDMEDVFGKEISFLSVLLVVILVVIAVVLIGVMVNAIRRKKNGGGEPQDPPSGTYSDPS